MQLSSLVRICSILDSYCDGCLSAEHDQVYLPGPPPANMDECDVLALQEHGASYDSGLECWYFFT